MLNIPIKYKNIKIFVYCSGKCGSTTLFRTLSQYYKTLHVHTNEEFYTTSQQKVFTIFDVIKCSEISQDKIYIIDSYRNPIERKIASFFNNINAHIPKYKKHKLRDLVKIFNNNYLKHTEEYHSIDEVMNHYHLPLFETFDFEKKYNLLVYKNINFIKLRFCDINNWPEILENIFNRNIILKNENMSENKDYSIIYNNFKKIYYVPNVYYNLQLPADIHFKIYNTEEEQKTYYEKWKERLLPNM
jgi:hypothetical protein